MKKISKRLLSVLLTAILLFSALPMTASAISYESENNNDYSSADTFSLNNSIKGKISSLSDIDIYKITTPNNGKLSLSFKHTYLDAYASWKVEIYQYFGGKYNQISSTEIHGYSDEIVKLPSIGATAKGTYYVKVSNATGYNDLIGFEYNIENKFSSTEYYEKELNDSYNTATEISLSNKYSGCMNSLSDIDIYKITTPNNGKLSLSFKHTYLDAYASWKVEIYQYFGGKYNQISSTEIHGYSDEIVKLPSIGATAKGTYYVKVSNATGYNDLIGFEYNLIPKFYAEGQTVSMYRLYNPNSGEHFYTSDINEKTWLVSLGWTYEGIGWVAPKTSSTPVYRLYNQNGGEHHYTTDINERNWLISLGWNDEGIGWYSDDAQGVPLYRQYNPNAFANNHNYTTDKGENDWLVGLGWKAEGISWYGVA